MIKDSADNIQKIPGFLCGLKQIFNKNLIVVTVEASLNSRVEWVLFITSINIEAFPLRRNDP
jgi:hypothetical protein